MQADTEPYTADESEPESESESYSEECSTDEQEIQESSESGNQQQTSEHTTLKTESITVTVPSEGGVDLTCDVLNELPQSVSTAKYTVDGTAVLPLKGEITSGFGERIHPIYKTEGFHKGIDIAAEQGTAIRAMCSGTVTAVQRDYGNGKYLIIDHGSGISTKYCHCSKISVKEGQQIKAGQEVARVGSTGLSTGPHLHFEFIINGISHNPQYALECASDEI